MNPSFVLLTVGKNNCCVVHHRRSWFGLFSPPRMRRQADLLIDPETWYVTAVSHVSTGSCCSCSSNNSSSALALFCNLSMELDMGQI